MNKNSQLLAYLAKAHNSATITVFMKLCYIVDLISVQQKGQSISNFNYIRYSYGPFTQDIYDTVNELVQDNVLTTKNDYTVSGIEYVTYRFSETDTFSFDLITDDEKRLVDEVMVDLQGYGAKVLTDIAYKTKPMKELGAEIGNTKGLFSTLNLSV